MTKTQDRRRAGFAAAAAAFVVASGAVVTSALALAHPAEPARHTVNVVSDSPMTFSSNDTEAASAVACAGWDHAARAIASAGNARGDLGDVTGLSSPETREARMVEKRAVAVEIKFLRTQISPVTPPIVKTPITDWMAAQIDSMHGANIRDWDASNAATERGNDLVAIIDARCGFS